MSLILRDDYFDFTAHHKKIYAYDLSKVENKSYLIIFKDMNKTCNTSPYYTGSDKLPYYCQCYYAIT